MHICFITVILFVLVILFIIHERLKSLLWIPVFLDLLEYEHLRSCVPANIMEDTYDSPAWKDFMRGPGYPCKRIGLQGCTDGFQSNVQCSWLPSS